MTKKNIKRNPVGEKIIDLSLDNYDINSLKNKSERHYKRFWTLSLRKRLNAEMDAHLSYDKNFY